VPVSVDEHHIPRAWIARPDDPPFLPAVERQLTIGPAGVQDKERKKFTARWAELTGEQMAPAA